MKILLTGATGIVGFPMVKEFLDQGHEVVCLIRDKNNLKAKKRLENKLSRPGGLPENCSVISGDITKNQCGIKQRKLEKLKQKEFDLVFHCAALTKMEDKYLQQAQKTNIQGTKNMLELTKQLGAAKFHFISTAYAANGQSNVYERTKLKAEKAVKESGVPYTISRLSIVIGDSETGEIDRFTGYYGFVLAVYKLVQKFGRDIKLYAEADEEATLNLIPVDWVVKTLALISDQEAYNGVLNVVNDTPIDVEKVLTMGLEKLGMVENVEFIDQVDLNADEHPRHQKLFNKVLATFRPYTKKEINLSTENLQDYLGAEYSQAPDITPELVDKIINYAVEDKFTKSIANG